MAYDIYPATDEFNNFPPIVRQALADSPELSATYALKTELATAGLLVVYHGSDAAFPRPIHPGAVFWIGTVVPDNKAIGDVGGNVSQQAIEPPIAWHTKFDASTLALPDLTAVDSWPDGSGNGHTAAQATAGLKPTFHVAAGGVPAFVRFDGGDSLAVAAFTAITQPITIIIVFRMTTVTTAVATKVLLSGIAATPNLMQLQQRGDGTNARWQAYAGTSQAYTTTPATAGVWKVLAFTGSGAGSTLRVNGVSQGLASVGTNGLTGLRLGSDFTPANYADMDLGDVRLHVGTVPGLAAVEQALCDKYDITWGV